MSEIDELVVIARQLSGDTASMLEQYPHAVQMLVLRTIKNCLEFWEEGDYQFDPVQLDGIYTAIACNVAPLAYTVTLILEGS